MRYTFFEMLENNTRCPTRYRARHFFDPLNAKLNPICHLLALLGAHHILHVSRIRVNNCNTNEDVATKFEQEFVHCVGNEEECVCSPLQISLQYPH